MDKKIIAFLITLLCSNCGDSNNPSTESQADLNPPQNLHSLNLENSIELRFNGSNTESEFKGYYIFGSKTSWAELQQLIKYPNNAGTNEDGSANLRGSSQ